MTSIQPIIGLAALIVFVWINNGVLALQRATEAGTSLIFGFLGGAPLPFEESYAGAAFVLAFRSFPLVLVVSALSALLYYWRVLPWIVQGFAWVLSKVMHIGGAASFATAANIFVGNVESPLLVRPYLDRMSRADLFIVMTAGLSTIAGTVFVLYSTLLRDVLPNAPGHLLTASVLSAPAAVVVVARLMVPAAASHVNERVEFKRRYESAMDAIATGTIDGLRLLAYAMCGFANFGGLGIMLGGLGALVPSRRKEILELGMKSLIAGNIATLMTGAVAALVA